MLLYAAFVVCSLVALSEACVGGGKPTTGQQSTGLGAALGGDIRAENYDGGGRGDLIEVSPDLDCNNFDNDCRWRNVDTDELDWVRGRGQPDPERFKFATGTSELPSDAYLMVASNPRDAAEEALFVSDPIGCQIGDGVLTFNHWISRTRNTGSEPRLNVCYRRVGSSSLEGCTPVFDPSPGPSTIFFPGPIDGPFEVVLQANNFVNRPEGGFIMVDNLEYSADVVDSNGCLSDPDPTTERPSRTTRTPELNFDFESCQLLKCPFDLNNEFCAMNPFGEGASGLGDQLGWRVTTGRENRANPLTGVRNGPDGRDTTPFGVADFPDTRQAGVDPGLTYSLETPIELTFSERQFLAFQRYIATEGTQLKLCRDPGAFDCLWESEPLIRGRNNAVQNREWREEVVELPAGAYTLYTIAQYDNQGRHNVGQIGISDYRVFEDRALRNPTC